MNSSKTIFRYDINALRALAILAVLLYHFKFSFLPGGFIGVDIFFVISGFLMTKIIFNDLELNKFSYYNFLMRRAFRLVPALVLMVFLVTAIELLVYFPWNVKESAKSGLAAILFISNIKFAQHTGYFNPASAFNIFLHTWSLSLEFQFYLIYPFILMGLKYFFRRSSHIIWILAFITLISFSYSIWLSGVRHDASFYLLPSRAWELLLGGLAFFYQSQNFSQRTRIITAIGSYMLLMICLFLMNQEMNWPGYFTLIPVFATFFIILADVDFTFLKSSGIQLTGRISYSLYLWHWPVFLISEYMGMALTVPNKLFLILLSAGLAYGSFIFIEKRKINTPKLIISYLALLTGVFICNRFTINESLFTSRTLEIANYIKVHQVEKSAQFSEGKCFNDRTALNNYNKKLCLQFSARKKNILLIGDSHAAQLSQSLRHLLDSKNINLLQATESCCLPLLSDKNDVYCKEMMNYIYKDFIVHHAGKIDGVILTGHWMDSSDQLKLITDLDYTINYLKKYKLKIILVGQTESYSVPYAEIAAREQQYKVHIRERYIEMSGAIFNHALAQHYAGSYINIYNEEFVPPLKLDKVPYLFDTHHLTKYGADLAVLKIYNDPITHRFLTD